MGKREVALVSCPRQDTKTFLLAFSFSDLGRCGFLGQNEIECSEVNGIRLSYFEK